MLLLLLLMVLCFHVCAYDFILQRNNETVLVKSTEVNVTSIDFHWRCGDIEDSQVARLTVRDNYSVNISCSEVEPLVFTFTFVQGGVVKQSKWFTTSGPDSMMIKQMPYSLAYGTASWGENSSLLYTGADDFIVEWEPKYGNRDGSHKNDDFEIRVYPRYPWLVSDLKATVILADQTLRRNRMQCGYENSFEIFSCSFYSRNLADPGILNPGQSVLFFLTYTSKGEEKQTAPFLYLASAQSLYMWTTFDTQSPGESTEVNWDSALVVQRTDIEDQIAEHNHTIVSSSTSSFTETSNTGTSSSSITTVASSSTPIIITELDSSNAATLMLTGAATSQTSEVTTQIQETTDLSSTGVTAVYEHASSVISLTTSNPMTPITATSYSMQSSVASDNTQTSDSDWRMSSSLVDMIEENIEPAENGANLKNNLNALMISYLLFLWSLQRL